MILIVLTCRFPTIFLQAIPTNATNLSTYNLAGWRGTIRVWFIFRSCQHDNDNRNLQLQLHHQFLGNTMALIQTRSSLPFSLPCQFTTGRRNGSDTT